MASELKNMMQKSNIRIRNGKMSVVEHYANYTPTSLNTHMPIKGNHRQESTEKSARRCSFVLGNSPSNYGTTALAYHTP